MDGFALVPDDDAPRFAIVETVAAGSEAPRALRRGECSRIMTGAMLPPGAGRVLRRELAEVSGAVMRPLGTEHDDNVVRRAASARAGAPVMGPRVLSPQDIGILAASGIDPVPVAVPPSTCVLCTGQEIRVPGEPLAPGQIYDSNGPQIRAQLAAMGCPSRFGGMVEDARGPLSAALETALAASELVLLTGGVSAGDFDYVPDCLVSIGGEIIFHGIAVKPGKPTLFGRRGAARVFGLPGNPVSAFVMFEMLVKPFLYRSMGLVWSAPLLTVKLGAPLRRRDAERMEFVPVRLRGGTATPVPYHGSSHVNALGDADGVLRIEKGVREIPEGEIVDVRSI